MAIVVPSYAKRVDNDAYLSPRVLDLLAAAYRAALVPATKRWISQGSWHHGPNSGSTHDGGGTGDIGHLWRYTPAEIDRLILELRKVGAVAWLRDEDHGGFAPHIHFIVRDEPGLSGGARWQIAEYDAGRNGLTKAGPDYHPRPAWRPFRASKWTAVLAKKTGFHTKPDPKSPIVQSRKQGKGVEYVDVVIGTDGKKWLVTPAGNYVLANNTFARWGK